MSQPASMTDSHPANVTARRNRSIADLRALGTSKAITLPAATIGAYMASQRPTLAALLPTHMTVERALAIAERVLADDPRLQQCTMSSLAAAVVKCAHLGLEPNGPQGHAFIRAKSTYAGVCEAEVITGWKGIVDLARRSGQITKISTRTVHLRDTFEVEYGTRDEVIHRPCLDEDPGPIRGFIAIAVLKGGEPLIEYMSRRQVDEIRDTSDDFLDAVANGREDSAWHQGYGEMGRKTVLKRLGKYLPLSAEVVEHLAREDRSEAGGSQALAQVLDLLPADCRQAPVSAPPEPKSEIPDAIEAEPEPAPPPPTAPRAPTKPLEDDLESDLEGDRQFLAELTAAAAPAAADDDFGSLD